VELDDTLIFSDEAYPTRKKNLSGHSVALIVTRMKYVMKIHVTKEVVNSTFMNSWIDPFPILV
jgi:hypothetical protein